jgi:hypothetical protein
MKGTNMETGCKAEKATISDMVIVVWDGLDIIQAIVDGRDGEMKERTRVLREAVPSDEVVDVIRKQLEEVIARIQGLQPRLRKIMRAL